MGARRARQGDGHASSASPCALHASLQAMRPGRDRAREHISNQEAHVSATLKFGRLVIAARLAHQRTRPRRPLVSSSSQLDYQAFGLLMFVN